MVLHDAEVRDNKITIRESELSTELDKLTDEMNVCRESNDFDRWLYLYGQFKVLKDILTCVQSRTVEVNC